MNDKAEGSKQIKLATVSGPQPDQRRPPAGETYTLSTTDSDAHRHNAERGATQVIRTTS